ncbi:MAG: hypothetical protein ACR2I7_09915, partial [Geodermatophilaceae bacterium]
MFEAQDLLDAADAAVLQQILDRELCDRYDNEITEPDYLQGLLDEHRGAPPGLRPGAQRIRSPR